MDSPLLDAVVTGHQIETWLSEYFGYPVKIDACRGQKIGDGQGFTSTIGRVSLEYKEAFMKNGQDSWFKNGEESVPKNGQVRKNGQVPKNDQESLPKNWWGSLIKNGTSDRSKNGTDPRPKNGADPRPKSGFSPLPRSVIFKTLNSTAVRSMMKKLSGENVPDDAPMDPFIRMHANECATYHVFGPNPPVPMPKVYKASDFGPDVVGVILMEDLSGKDNVTCGDAPGDMSLEQLYLVAEMLADLHGWCWKNEHKWKEGIQSYSTYREGFAHLVNTMKNNVQKTKATYPGAFDSLDVDGAVDYVAEGHPSSQFRKLQQEIYPDVIVHGDFYGPNFIFKRHQTGRKEMEMKLIGVIDWALCHEGCGMEDLARLMTLSVDTQTRRDHTKDILEHYYKNLVKKVGAENMKASFDDIVHIYNVHFVLAGFFFVFLLNWLQGLYVNNENGEKGKRAKKKIFDRCVGVYEDVLPLWKEIQAQSSYDQRSWKADE